MVRVFGVSVRLLSVNSGSRIGIIMRRGVGYSWSESERLSGIYSRIVLDVLGGAADV